LEKGFPGYIVNLLVNLYRKQKAKVKVAGTISRGFLGSVKSSNVFNILAEMMMRKALERYEGG